MTEVSPLDWDRELLGAPPGSLVLTCPECLERNWYSDPFTPEEDMLVVQWRLQSAYRLRAAYMGIPFYAQRAEQARARYGTEMPYWLGLQGSQIKAQLPVPPPESVIGLTPADLPKTLRVAWLSPVERLALRRRRSALVDKQGASAASQETPPN